MGLGGPWGLPGKLSAFCILSHLCLAQPHTHLSSLQGRSKGGSAHPLWSWTTQVASRGFFWWMMISWG